MACCVVQQSASLSFGPVEQGVHAFTLNAQQKMFNMISTGFTWSKSQQVSIAQQRRKKRHQRAFRLQLLACWAC